MTTPGTPGGAVTAWTDDVLVSRHPQGVVVVTLNRPERMNGLSSGLKRDLEELLLQLQFDDSARVLVLTGAGTRAFCAGDDISGKHANPEVPETVPELPDGPRVPVRQYERLRKISQSLTRILREIDKPTIAAVNGDAIQSGLTLALACDFRIVSRAARLGSATLRFGFLPDEGGHYLLVQHLGLAGTLEFLMRKRIVTAEEAAGLGLVTEVVAPEDTMTHALELAAELAAGPQVAMRMLKRSIYTAAEVTFEHALEDIATKASISDFHDDARDGRPAFRERRPARFNQWLEHHEAPTYETGTP